VDYSRRPWTVEGLATYERMLAQRAPSPFALGAAPGVADICITGQVVEAHYLKAGTRRLSSCGGSRRSLLCDAISRN
jgi:glutathione S-transferase